MHLNMKQPFNFYQPAYPDQNILQCQKTITLLNLAIVLFIYDYRSIYFYMRRGYDENKARQTVFALV